MQVKERLSSLTGSKMNDRNRLLAVTAFCDEPDPVVRSKNAFLRILPVRVIHIAAMEYFSMNKLFQGVITMMLAVMPLVGCSSEPPAQGTMPPPLVEVMTIEAKDEPVTYEFVGQTEGSRAVEVRAQVSGLLMKRAYEEGATVTKGQLLFEIEPDTYKAALDQALGAMAQVQSRYTQAKQDLDRVLPLYAKNAVSQRDRDTAQAAFNGAKADMDAAKAAVDEARIKLNYAYVVSPVSGYAGKEYRSVGNLIAAGSPTESLLTVVNQVDPMYANFSLSSPFFMRMRTLHAQGRLSTLDPVVHITLADNSRYPTPGKLTFIDKAVNPGTSVISARAEFPNPDLFVLPGQFVRVTLSNLFLKNAILVPQKAIIQTQKGAMVIIVDKDNKAQMRPVRLSDNIGNNYLLEEGLTSGERIIVEGTNKAIPGQPVRIDAPQK